MIDAISVTILVGLIIVTSIIFADSLIKMVKAKFSGESISVSYYVWTAIEFITMVFLTSGLLYIVPRIHGVG